MIQILPIGTPVWVAQAARPDGTRRALADDGVVTGRVPCTDCWRRCVDDGGQVSVVGYRAAAAACREPAGYVVSVRGFPVTVIDGDPTVIAVPITTDERSAA